MSPADLAKVAYAFEGIDRVSDAIMRLQRVSSAVVKRDAAVRLGKRLAAASVAVFLIAWLTPPTMSMVLASVGTVMFICQVPLLLQYRQANRSLEILRVEIPLEGVHGS